MVESAESVNNGERGNLRFTICDKNQIKSRCVGLENPNLNQYKGFRDQNQSEIPFNIVLVWRCCFSNEIR